MDGDHRAELAGPAEDGEMVGSVVPLAEPARM